VLAHGPGWLAVDKPAGMPVHPLAAGERGTILGAVAARHPEIQGIGEGGLRSGVVHRLDVDTSGALLFATNDAQWQRLRAAFSEHRDRQALSRDRARPGRVGRRDRAAARDRAPSPRVRARGAARRARGRAAHGHALAGARAIAWATLLEVRTVTGFLHQVRATLAHLGHPLAGDRSYAPEGDATGAARHMLHAAALRFEEIAAECPDPRDFAQVLAALRIA
jgi:23S rRNA pseudouridine1911/1915/1917 synthase